MNGGTLVIEVDVTRIIIQTDETGALLNPRGPIISTTDLQDSIRSRGLRVPIEVRPHPTEKNMYFLRHGHRRLSAVKALGWKSVRCFVTQPPVPPEVAPIEDVLDMLAGEVIEEYPPLSVALAIHRLLEAGKTRKEIGDAWGRPADIVSAYAQMIDAHPVVHDALTSGRLKPSVFARIKNWPQEEQAAVIQDAPDGEITMRWVVGQARSRRLAREDALRAQKIEQATAAGEEWQDPKAPVTFGENTGLRELYGRLLSVVKMIERQAVLEPVQGDPTVQALHQEVLSVMARVRGGTPERTPAATIPSDLFI